MNQKKWLILFVIMLANSMVFLDASILPVALPTIQYSLHASNLALQWMMNSYLLAMAIFVLIAGIFGDIYSHRKIFCSGILLFGLSSLFCAISQQSWQLIISRFFQGIGSAMIMPTSLALIYENFEKNNIGRIMGYTSIANCISITMGPLLGGILTQFLSWHYIFIINIPIAFFNVIFAWIMLKQSQKHPQKINISGFIFFILSITCLTIAIMQAQVWGWSDYIIIFLFCLSAVGFVLLYFIDTKTLHPCIDFSLFKFLLFTIALIIIGATSITRMISMYWTIYFQNILNLTPFMAGLLAMVASIPMAFFAPYVGRLYDRIGPQKPVIYGHIFLITSLIGMLFFIPKGYYVLIAIFLLLFGLGIILLMLPVYSSGLSPISENKRGRAAGIINSVRMIATCLGVAILGSTFYHVQKNTFESNIIKYSETKNLSAKSFEGYLSHSKSAIEAMQSLPKDTQNIVINLLKSSFHDGLTISFIVAIFIMAISFLIVIIYYKPKKRDFEKDEVSIEP